MIITQTDRQTDRQTDGQTHQNYSSEPHKIHKNKGIAILLLFYLGFRV